MFETEQLSSRILEVERAVIGACLMSPVREWPPLLPAEFYADRHRTMWGAMRDLTDQVERPDAVLLAAELERRGDLQAVGGDLIARCLEEAITVQAVMDYARVVRQAARDRSIKILGAQLVREGLSEQEIMARLAELPGPLAAGIFDPEDLWRNIEQDWTAQRRILRTGIGPLDTLTGGVAKGQTVVLGGRTSHGKTALACYIALGMAKADVSVDLFTLEDPPDAILRRLVSQITGITTRRLRDGGLSQSELDDAREASGMLAEMPLSVTGLDTLKSLDEDTIVGAVSALRADVVIVDHLQQVITNGDSRSRVYGIERFLARLCAAAQREPIGLIVTAQLNREIEARQGPPRISDLRDCGAIEQIARQIWLAYWPCKMDQARNPIDYELYVAKNSEGGTATLTLQFDARTGRFRENGQA